MNEELNDIISDSQEESTKANKKQKKEKTDKKKSISFVEIVSGDFLTKDFVLRNIPFILFIIFLGLLSVSKGYYVKQVEQNINKTQKQLDAVTTDYVESKAKLEEETSRGNLVQRLEGTGLKETTNPVKVIRIEEEK
jgi:cell division protein FtsL